MQSKWLMQLFCARNGWKFKSLVTEKQLVTSGDPHNPQRIIPRYMHHICKLYKLLPTVISSWCMGVSSTMSVLGPVDFREDKLWKHAFKLSLVYSFHTLALPNTVLNQFLFLFIVVFISYLPLWLLFITFMIQNWISGEFGRLCNVNSVTM